MRTLLVCLILLAMCGCSVPGKILLKRDGTGQWQAVEAEFERENITPAEIQKIEDRLNGR